MVKTIERIPNSKDKKYIERIPNLKDKIISTAIKIFSEKGYEATNMAEIADILGITRTPLYYYFSGKKSLYTEAIKKHLSEKREIYADLASEDDDIFTWLRKHIEYACSNKSDSVLFNVFNHEEFRALSDLNSETNRYIYALKQRRVLRAKESGELPSNLDVSLFLDHVYVMSYGLIYAINDSLLSQELTNSPERVKALIDQYINGIKATVS